MNKDQVNGRTKEIIGQVKEVIGKITNDKDLEVKGNIQKNIGKAQADFGDLKNNLKKWLLLKRIQLKCVGVIWLGAWQQLQFLKQIFTGDMYE